MTLKVYMVISAVPVVAVFGFWAGVDINGQQGAWNAAGRSKR